MTALPAPSCTDVVGDAAGSWHGDGAMRALLDGSMFVEQITGDGPPLLLLHGWGRNRHDLLGLSAGRAAMAPDLPGFGASPAPPAGWGAREYADHLARACAQSGAGPFVVVGHSFGGRVAVHLAAAHPEHVLGVVLIGVPLIRRRDQGTPPLGYRIVRFLARRKLIPQRVLEEQRRRRGSADYNAATGVMREVFVRVVNEDYREQLQAIGVPVALCWGAEDSAAPLAQAREAAQHIGDLRRFEVVAGAGHFVHRDAPDRVGAVIDELLAAAS